MAHFLRWDASEASEPKTVREQMIVWFNLRPTTPCKAGLSVVVPLCLMKRRNEFFLEGLLAISPP